MDKIKVLLLDPDKEQAEALLNWLKEEGYETKLVADTQEALNVLAAGKFDCIIVDTDSTDETIELYGAVKKDLRFSNISFFTTSYKTRIKEVTRLIAAGVEGLLFKPFDVEDFSKRLKALTKEADFAKRGKKLLDQNYLNDLIELAGTANREDFFPFSAAIFNKLILGKIKSILGGPVITQIIKRCDELIGDDYAFMKEVKFSNEQLLLDGVDKASKDIPVKKLTMAFRDYVYAFLQLVRALTSDILMERGGVGVKDSGKS